MKKVVPYIISSLALVLSVVACVIAVKNKPKTSSSEVGYFDFSHVVSRIESASQEKAFSATLIETEDIKKCQRRIDALKSKEEQGDLSKHDQKKLEQLKQEKKQLLQAEEAARYKLLQQLFQSKTKEFGDTIEKLCKEKNISFLCMGRGSKMTKEGAYPAPIHPCDITEEVLKAIKLDEEATKSNK
jgi:Skp family chaperone for outer membrane proteins